MLIQGKGGTRSVGLGISAFLIIAYVILVCTARVIVGGEYGDGFHY
jgi:hypothetical protein